MEKDLELRLIEDGYDTTKERRVRFPQVYQFIQKQLTREYSGPQKGMILFDGSTEAWVTMRQRGDELGSFHLDKPAIAIHGVTHLHISPAYDNVLGAESSSMSLPSGFSVEPKGKNYEVQARHKQTGTFVHILFHPKYGTRILYVPRTDNATADKRFWQYVIEQCGLKLTKTTKPLAKGGWPAYRALDVKSGAKVTLGTKPAGLYTLIVEFPEAKSRVDLDRSVEGLKVNVYSIDDRFVVVPRGGKKIEASAHRGRGSHLVAYLTNLLRGPPLRFPSPAREIS